MPKPEHASESAVERLKREIAADRARIQSFRFVNEIALETEASPVVGRLYQVFVAMGQV